MAQYRTEIGTAEVCDMLCRLGRGVPLGNLQHGHVRTGNVRCVHRAGKGLPLCQLFVKRFRVQYMGQQSLRRLRRRADDCGADRPGIDQRHTVPVVDRAGSCSGGTGVAALSGGGLQEFRLLHQPRQIYGNRTKQQHQQQPQHCQTIFQFSHRTFLPRKVCPALPRSCQKIHHTAYLHGVL